MSYIYIESFLSSISNFLTNFFEIFEGKKQSRILLLGLDNAGKTTLLYKLKLGEIIPTQPTVGFNVEEVRYKNLTFTMWDLGGQEKNRCLWRSYLDNIHAIIFVIDSCDKARLPEIKKEIFELDKIDILKDTVFLVLCNKQDCNTALNSHQVSVELDMDKINRKWNALPICAIRDEDEMGIYEGFEWLKKNIVWK